VRGWQGADSTWEGSGSHRQDGILRRLFPTADRLNSQEILELVSADEEGVFILYEYELKTGARHRNTEFITVRDGQIVEIQVFFGGQIQ
jgi:ketosteroid isomerase-like protein